MIKTSIVITLIICVAIVAGIYIVVSAMNEETKIELIHEENMKKMEIELEQVKRGAPNERDY